MRFLTLTSTAALLVALSGAAHADIVIGSAGPLTNGEALFGTTWMNGMELAVRQAMRPAASEDRNLRCSERMMAGIQSRARWLRKSSATAPTPSQ